jgi:AcrR family transcriptional regulator
MRTDGTDVKVLPERPPDRGDKRLVQGEATRATIVGAARALFGEQGYAATSTEDIVARAGVTKGALYHHFDGKPHLFRIVLEQVLAEISERVVAILWEPGLQALVDGSMAWVDAHQDPAVRQIVVRDARAVLDVATMRDIETRFGVVPVRARLRMAVTAGVIDDQPLRPLALMLIGALREATLHIADADDPATAREEVHRLVERILGAFRSAGSNAARR